MRKSRTWGIVAAATAVALSIPGTAPATASHDHGDDGHGKLRRVVGGLDGPRGVDALGHGRTLVTETNGTFSLVVERKHRRAKVIRLSRVKTNFPPAIAKGRGGNVFVLTGEQDGRNSAKLFKWHRGMKKPRLVANIGRYQQRDPDPFNLAEDPGASNPFGIAALHDGSLLVSDAANNDLLRVFPKSGKIVTVARLKPRKVKVPKGLPDAGKRVPSEAVATSVTVGKDGFWYVGELRGFPATKGKSQIWRIKPGVTGAVCNPGKPQRGACKRFADGLTSIVDLGASHKGILAVTLSKQTWLALEQDPPPPGARVGGLFLVRDRDHDGRRIKELVRNRLILPGGVDVTGRTIYEVDPIFGKGALRKIR